MKSLDARLALLEKAAPPKWHITVTVVPEGEERDDPPPEPGVIYVRVSPHGNTVPAASADHPN